MAQSGQSRKQQARSEREGHSMQCPVHRRHSHGPHLLVARLHAPSYLPG